jgi:hypothetical protein
MSKEREYTQEESDNLRSAYEGMSQISVLLDENASEAKVNEAILRFEYVCYTFWYTDVIRGYIYDSESIIHALEFFLRIRDDRAYVLANQLHKYYPGEIEKEFQRLLEEEKYELCELYKYVAKTK